MSECKACLETLHELVIISTDGIPRAWVGGETLDKYIAKFSLQAHHELEETLRVALKERMDGYGDDRADELREEFGL